MPLFLATFAHAIKTFFAPGSVHTYSEHSKQNQAILNFSPRWISEQHDPRNHRLTPLRLSTRRRATTSNAELKYRDAGPCSPTCRSLASPANAFMDLGSDESAVQGSLLSQHHRLCTSTGFFHPWSLGSSSPRRQGRFMNTIDDTAPRTRMGQRYIPIL